MVFRRIRAKLRSKQAAPGTLATSALASKVPPSSSTALPPSSTALPPSFSDLSASLWDAAYSEAKKSDAAIVEAYEKILSARLLLAKDADHNVPASTAADGSQQDLSMQENWIAADAIKRREQMQELLNGINRAEKKAKLQRGVEIVAETASIFKEAVDKTIQAAPQAALAWVGVCLGLQLLQNPVEELAASRSGIAFVVSRMEYYGNMSSLLLDENIQQTTGSDGPAKQMQASITELYTVLLLYEMRTICYHHRHRFTQIPRGLLKLDGWKAELANVKDAEKVLEARSLQYNTAKSRNDLGRLLASSETRNAKLDSLAAAIEKQTAVYHKHEAQKRAANELEKHNQLKKDLYASDSADDKKRIEETQGGLLEKAYAWVLQNIEFLSWKDSPECRLLWISGDAGKGKTMMLCGIINELEASQSVTVSYFFCQASNDSLNSAIAVLRGLIYSLISKQPYLMKHVQARYNGHDEGLFRSHNAWVVLKEIFHNMIRDPNLGCVYLLVDALDECTTSLDQLMRLISHEDDEGIKVKWVITSRPWPEIEMPLRKVACKCTLSLESNAETISEAVALFTSMKVNQLAEEMGYSSSTKSAVLDHLSENAGNTFLWVALVCEVLKKEPAWNVNERTLANLPPGLGAIYNRMTKHIRDSGDKALIYRRVLGNVLVACRPLSLLELVTSVEELQSIADQPEQIRDVVRRCGSFLTIRQESVYFVHYSAKEYLSEHETEWSVDGVSPHYTMVLRALRTMSTDLKRNMYCLEAPESRADTAQPPVPDTLAHLRYSCFYWGDHLEELRTANFALYNQLTSVEGPFHHFLTTGFLYWIEALSLCKSLRKGSAMMGQLNSYLEALSISHSIRSERDGNEFKSLVTDAYRFIMYHQSTIEKYPLQVYNSALLFSPTTSRIPKLFESERPKGISIIQNPEQSWSACLQTLEYGSGSVRTVALTPCLTLLAFGWSVFGPTVQVWDVRNNIRVCDLQCRLVASIAISPDTMFVATAGEGVVLWSSKTGQCVRTFDSMTVWTSTLAFSPNSRHLLSTYPQDPIKVWNTDNGACLYSYQHTDNVTSAIYSHKGLMLAATKSSCTPQTGSLFIFSFETNKLIKEYITHHPVSRLASSPDSSMVAWTDCRTIYTWKWATDGQAFSFGTDQVSLGAMAFLNSPDILATACSNATVRIWSATTGGCLQTLTGHSSEVSLLTVSQDMILASFSKNGILKLWQLDSSQWSEKIEMEEAEMEDAEAGWITGPHYALTRAADIIDEFIDQNENRKLLQTLSSDASASQSSEKLLALSPDYYLLATVYTLARGAPLLFDETGSLPVRILDRREQVWEKTRGGHSKRINAVRFSPDSSLVASSADDMTVKIWQAATRELQLTLKHEFEVIDAIFTNDKRLVSLPSNGIITVWELCGTRLQTIDSGYSLTRDSWLAVSSDTVHLARIDIHMPGMFALRMLNLDNGASSRLLGQLKFYGTAAMDAVFTADCLQLQTRSGILKIDQPAKGWVALSTVDGVKYHGAGLREFLDRALEVEEEDDIIKWELWLTYNGKRIAKTPMEIKQYSSRVWLDKVCMQSDARGLWLCSISEQVLE